MSFIDPTLAGIAAVTGLIPVLVHLINRRRYRRVEWAAMAFLLAASRRSAKRVRIEQWLVLLTRIAAIVLFGMALARPYLSRTPLIPIGTTRSHHILLVDNSRSMNAVDFSPDADPMGSTRFARAQEAARSLIATLPDTDAVGLIALAAPAKAVIAQPAFDRRFVREQLAKLAPTQRVADLTGALALATRIVDELDTGLGNISVYLISDYPRRLWHDRAGATGSAEAGTGSPIGAGPPAVVAIRALAKRARVHLVLVAPKESENVAITQLWAESSLAGVNQPVRFTAVVENFGAEAARGLSFHLLQDGRIVRRQPLSDIGPGGAARATVSTLFAAPGTHMIEARLVPQYRASDRSSVVASRQVGGLEDDDTRHLSVQVRRAVPILLVDGRPGASRLAGQAGYLATALAPGAGKTDSARSADAATGSAYRSVFEPRIITEPELASQSLRDVSVLALCNVARLSPKQWQHVEEFVGAGGGLLVFAGELLVAKNYNRYGYADGGGVLPVRIGPRALTDGETNAHVRFSSANLDHPIAADFLDHGGSGLFLSRIRQYLTVQMDGDDADGRIVLRYTSGDPALVAGRYGSGRTVLCTTTANMDWNNLAAKGDYVSLMAGVVTFLTPQPGRHRNVLVGARLHEPLSPVQTGMPLRVTCADGSRAEGRLVPDGDALGFDYRDTDKPGFYALSLGADTLHFAVNVDPVESDLRCVDADNLTSTLGDVAVVVAARDVGERAVAPAASSELALASLWIVLLLLLAEVWIAMWFGSRREG